jgi:hypothetical protein
MTTMTMFSVFGSSGRFISPTVSLSINCIHSQIEESAAPQQKVEIFKKNETSKNIVSASCRRRRRHGCTQNTTNRMPNFGICTIDPAPSSQQTLSE